MGSRGYGAAQLAPDPKFAPSAVAPPMPAAAPAPDLYAMPATQGQMRFWALDSLNPGNPALNMPLMWQYTGELDIDTLSGAFAACVRRHESLRTTFALADGKLQQIIHPEMPVTIPTEDLTTLTGEAQRLEADRITRLHAAFRFDLARGPLLVLRLLRLGERNHLLLVTMHHIICDGLSNGILMRDMLAYYEAAVTDAVAPNLPELPIQFADYAVWHETWRQSPEHEASMKFWRQELGEGFQPIHLEHDPDAEAAIPSHRAENTGYIETCLVPHDLARRALDLCARESVTPNVLFFALFVALLSRMTGKHDLTLGSPCANRTEDTEDLIGMFMNIQVFRARLAAQTTFRELLAQVRAWQFAAVEHQALPFEDLLSDPFFEKEDGLEIPVFFLYQKSFMLIRRIVSRTGRSLRVVPLRSESPGAIFELMFAVVDREEGPRLQLEYNPHHFKATTVQNMLRMFLNLMESALAEPGIPVDRLDVISAGERGRILAAGNETAREFGPFQPVHEVLLTRAVAEPGRLAIRCGGESWTLARLAEESRAIAALLLENGIRPGDRVGLYIGRSPQMLAAVLGTHIAGAAYVPLDPRHPRERIDRIVGNAEAAAILADREPPFAGRILRIDAIYPATRERARTLQPAPADPNALAYVIYTSGSTGAPKGVAIEHASLFNLLHTMAETPGLTPADRLVAITTLGFDIATLELLLPMLVGAELILATDDEVADPELLLALLKSTEATVLQATPGAWRRLIEVGWSSANPLKALCGGEAMSRDLADKLLERTPTVWNMYGPTETTIWSSATPVAPGTEAPRVGPAVANTTFHVLDANLRPVPFGVEGELFIGGSGLARGYWNKPKLTAERFLPNPFGTGRLYRTGDLARLFEDGTVQLLGRADFQVKIRGYRIELGEIEAALRAHTHVGEAVVIKHETPDQPGIPGITRLVAYVEAPAHAGSDRAPALVAELHSLLARSMPEYMLPNAILALEHLPQNTNGKVDRAQLPDPFTTAGDRGVVAAPSVKEIPFQGPRDILERQITDLWQKTLGIDRISVRADFFSLGVGSLAALRLITKMNRIYKAQLGLATLVTAPSIEALATLLRHRMETGSTSTLVPLKPEGKATPLFITHGVGGNVISFHGLAMRLDSDTPIYGIQAQSLLPGEPALLHIEDMAARYVREMRDLQPHGPYRVLGYSFGGTLALEIARQLRAAGESVSFFGLLDSRSKEWEHHQRALVSAPDRVAARMERMQRNTAARGDWKHRLGYLQGKLRTRGVRFTAALAARLGLKTMPPFFKSAEDINIVALERYQPTPFQGRIVLFRALEQDFPGGPRDLGWESLSTHGVEIVDVEGDHDRLFLEPCIDELAAAINGCLQQTAPTS